MFSIAQAMQSRFTETTKQLEVQIQAAVSDGPNPASDVGFGQVWSGWWNSAPPFDPKVDGSGNVKGAAEYVFAEVGDVQVCVGSRDTRFSFILADVKPGEVGLCNAFGARFVMQKKSVMILGGGGFLNFDLEAKEVALSGIPAGPGEGASFIGLNPTGIGLVTASGGASVSLDADSISISGASCAIDAGQINLGGAAALDPAVGTQQLILLVTQLTTMVTTLLVWANAHTHIAIAPGAPTAPALPPLVLIPPLPPIPKTRVFLPMM